VSGLRGPPRRPTCYDAGVGCVFFAIAALLSGCGDTPSSPPADSGDDAVGMDAGVDAMSGVDAGLDAPSVDGATPDAGTDPEVFERRGRPEPEQCDSFREPMEIAMRRCGCSSDEECGDGDNGRCSIDHDVRHCTYDECFEDDDCPTGTACACNVGPNHTNQCVTAMCTRDADCGGFACGLSRSCGGGSGRVGPPEEFRCHTALDECTADADCGGPTRFCRWGGTDSTGHWVDDRWMCNDSCAIGPPPCP